MARREYPRRYMTRYATGRALKGLFSGDELGANPVVAKMLYDANRHGRCTNLQLKGVSETWKRSCYCRNCYWESGYAFC